MSTRQARRDKALRELPLYVMLLPAVLLVTIYSYGSMLGVTIAFQKFLLTVEPLPVKSATVMV